MPPLSISPLLPSPFPSFKPYRHHLSPPSAAAQHREHISADGPPWHPPAAPWMRSPPSVPGEDLVELSIDPEFPERRKTQRPGDAHLTTKIRGGRSRHVMRRMAQRIAKLQRIDPEAAEEGWDGGELGARAPWVRTGRAPVFRRVKKERETTEAEAKLEREVLERLRGEARRMTRWIRAKKSGVTEGVVRAIREVWKESELAMVKLVEPLSRNMDRAREIVETKTGGLVVWTKKDTLVVYRGSNCPRTAEAVCGPVAEVGTYSPSEPFVDDFSDRGSPITKFGGTVELKYDKQSQPSSIFIEVDENTGSVTGSLYERETDRLLNGLGPRFVDWWMRKPLPVDADLLPEVVPDFKPPFRSCLSHDRVSLSDDELKYLRNLAHLLPIHFALGKNTKLQGLAAAIIKLWERSLIAKIAVKRGIPNTNDEIMSSELKQLTGGTLILRNKFYIILYRGKDFLPGRVANLIIERETELRNLQFEEEQARQRAAELLFVDEGMQCDPGILGTFTEFCDIQTSYSSHQNSNLEMKVKMEAEKEKLEKDMRKQNHQLSVIKRKLDRSNEILAQINSTSRPSAQATDQELLTEEERQKFYKIGIRMDEVLLLGRRGIYDAVIGSMHLHWRHRELVKVVTMQKSFSEILRTAQLLELESGGILISIEKYKSGTAIVIFRGKNYRSPPKFLSENLLTKKKACQRSVEVQRRGSLKFFACQREESILALESKIKSLEEKLKGLEAGQPQDDS